MLQNIQRWENIKKGQFSLLPCLSGITWLNCDRDRDEEGVRNS